MTLTSSLSIPGASVPCAGAPKPPDLNPAAMLGGGATRGLPSSPAPRHGGIRPIRLWSDEGVPYIGFVLKLDADTRLLERVLYALRPPVSR
jgi:hypothetical protein